MRSPRTPHRTGKSSHPERQIGSSKLDDLVSTPIENGLEQPNIPIVVISDTASSDEIMRIIGYGARG